MTIETEITPVSKAQQALQLAATPEQSKEVEAMAAAAKAWAKEQGYYELAFQASHIYIDARRKTTELIEPNIHVGRPINGNRDVTFLEDFNLTKMQWSRRRQELEIPEDEVSSYLDDCIEKRALPTPTGLVKYVQGPHVFYNGGENEWYTPPQYIEAARRVMGGIDTDPASSIGANKVVKAKLFYTAEDDGRDKPWRGNVWMNPPYSQPFITHFCRALAAKFKAGEITQACVLVNNATETNWFSELVSVAAAAVFPGGRVRFLDPQGNRGAPLQGQAVIYVGENVDAFIGEFGGLGWSALIHRQ